MRFKLILLVKLGLVMLLIYVFIKFDRFDSEKINKNYTVIKDTKLGHHAIIAKKLLNQKEYEVISYSKKTSSSYTLTKEKLEDKENTYEAYIWKLQSVSPERFIGKTIYKERFIVKNHPLDHWKSGSTKSEGMTYVDVFVVDENAVGGVSAPVTKDALVGRPYSLEGKTLDELHISN